MGWIVATVEDEPVTLAEAKSALRIDTDDLDNDIIRALATAREICEHRIETAIPMQTIEAAYDAFPSDGFPLRKVPAVWNPGVVVEVESVVYVDRDGVRQTMAPGDYYLDQRQSPCWLLPALDTGWPAAREEANAVVITYRTGYDQCPSSLKDWIVSIAGSIVDKVEPSPFLDGLLDRWRVYG